MNCSALRLARIPDFLQGQVENNRVFYLCSYSLEIEYYATTNVVVVTESGSVVQVPNAWLEQYNLAQSQTAASGTAANGRKVWECYLAGLDPTDPDDDLVAMIGYIEGHLRVYPKDPKPNRVYRIKGAATLDLSAIRTDVTDEPDLSATAYRFFRIEASPAPAE